MTAAMVLAAGLGTRLRPLTDELPKPLVPVGDRAMLAHVIGRLRDAGCSPIVVNAHHHADAVARACDALGAIVSREDEDLLGTAGGLSRARALLGDGDVLVHNGDVLTSASLAGLVEAHTDAAATLLVVPRAAGEGNVGSDDRGVIVRLRKETFAPGETHGGEFTGIHVVSARVRETLRDRGCLVGDVYMPRLRAHSADLYVYSASEFVDVGSPAGYLAANLAWLASQGLESFVGKDVIVDPHVTLDHCVIGDGARITGEGVLSRCVVWPRAVAHAPVRDAVITGQSLVRC